MSYHNLHRPPFYRINLRYEEMIIIKLALTKLKEASNDETDKKIIDYLINKIVENLNNEPAI